jgi:hypothetical protein
MNFREWLKQNEANAIVGCKDKGNSSFQVWGAMSDLNCRKHKKARRHSRQQPVY